LKHRSFSRETIEIDKLKTPKYELSERIGFMVGMPLLELPHLLAHLPQLNFELFIMNKQSINISQLPRGRHKSAKAFSSLHNDLQLGSNFATKS